MKRTVLGLVIAAVALGVLAATGAASGGSFKVTSTLDGKRVLPHRIHWIASPRLPSSQIAEVKFLIDGKLRWIEHHAPYVYGEDEHGRHRNYLVTSWLRPGKHTFAAQAIAKNGRSAADTVVARVVLPPAVPSALAGSWQRTIDTSGAPKPGTSGNPTDTLTPSGTYQLAFDRAWIRDTFPCDTSPCRFNPKTGGGGEGVSDWTPAAGTFTVRGPVTFRVFHNTDRLGGWWCWEDGPSAKYTWSVSGNTLKLAPIGGHDACGIRGFIWTGTWSRVG
jgi:hypothetical protein